MTKSPTRESDDTDLSLGDFMATRKVVPKCDRRTDVYDYIDELRQDRLDDRERMRAMWNYVRALNNKVRDTPAYTESGIYKIVQGRWQVRWLKFEGKVFWIALTAGVSLVGSLMVWAASHLAWK